MLADILLNEIDKHESGIAPAHRHIIMLARELAKKYKEQHETLASITTMYVKMHHELDDAKRQTA